MKRVFGGFLAAILFMTRLPLPRSAHSPLPLSSAAPYFPSVGALLGLGAAALDVYLRPHLGAGAAAVATVLFLVMITGALHEDGLADCADGLGGGRTREQALHIMRDSRIGSYGALAIAGSLVARTTLIAELAPVQTVTYIICTECLSRWTVLPLAYVLSPARTEGAAPGQGARIAGRLPTFGIVASTLFCLAITVSLLHAEWWRPWIACILVTAMSAVYFQRRIGGITGDCFGAVIQISATAVYVCGAWR